MISVTINNIEIKVLDETTILEAARSADIYIPTVCSHPDLPPFHFLELSDAIYQGKNKFVNDDGMTIESIKGCGICIVEIEGESKPIPSCKTVVKNGMNISTETDTIKKQRKQNLMRIMAEHPHSCLTCSQREGCIPLTDVCAGNVPFEERCCNLLGNCELQKVVEYVGIAPETPRYIFKNKSKIESDPLFIRDYNLCISCGRCVRVCQHVKGVYALGGVISEGKLIIGTVNGPKLNEAECKFCGSCVEVCPTGAIQDKIKPRLKEYSEFLPCAAACPGEVDIPLYLHLVSKGKIQEAAEVIAARLTFPSVLGKVCFHPCEVNCRHNEVSEILTNSSEPVNIRMIKDFAMSNSTLPSPKKIAENTGKSVAVIGSGPAGLTAAYFLVLKGHSVTVFEKEDELGGMLRYGIPRYRLPLDVLEQDINRILETGIKVKTNTTIGTDKTIESIRNEYDSVFISTGLPISKSIPIEDVNDIHIKHGIEFLSSVSKNEIDNDTFKSKSVIIIGGGNVAIDAARTAIRLQADKVTLVCLEQKSEMPAYDIEIIEAEEEGIQLLNGWGIAKFENLSQDKNTIAISLKKCVSVFNNQGEFAPEYDESITDRISGDEVIICIGQQANMELFDNESGNFTFSGGIIQVNKNTLETNIKGVFAGGDIVSGPASVIDAVGYGRKAAKSIDKFLGGEGNINFNMDLHKDNEMYIGREEGFCLLERVNPKYIEAENRKLNFNTYELIYDQESAVNEASRCLKCGLRLKIRHNPAPPEKFLQFTSENIETVPSEEGVIQLLDDKKEVYHIEGSDNMKKALIDKLNSDNKAAHFIYEADPMFTKRESELLQQYLQKHGKMPDSGDDLDDLF